MLNFRSNIEAYIRHFYHLSGRILERSLVYWAIDGLLRVCGMAMGRFRCRIWMIQVAGFGPYLAEHRGISVVGAPPSHGVLD